VNGTKVKILTFPQDCCPKLFSVAQDVASSPEKAVIMTNRTTGYIVMLELMKLVASKAEPPFGVASVDQLAEFNHVSNLRGEKYRVLVADAIQCSEGVSFLAVRRTFLTDVPTSPSLFVQQCGRAIRMYGHRGLPLEEQTVTNQLYVATLPKWMRSSLACWAFRSQKKLGSGKEMEKRAKVLTARLHRAGIKTLGELKERIDAHGAAKRDDLYGTLDGAAIGGDGNGVEHAPAQIPDGVSLGPDKIVLSSSDVVGFLEQNGLWEEAKLLRQAEKKEQEKTLNELERKAALVDSIQASQAGSVCRTDTFTDMESLDRQEESTLRDEILDGTRVGENVNCDATEEETKAGGSAAASLEDDDLETALESVIDESMFSGLFETVPKDSSELPINGNGIPDCGALHSRGVKDVASDGQRRSAVGADASLEPEATAGESLTTAAPSADVLRDVQRSAEDQAFHEVVLKAFSLARSACESLKNASLAQESDDARRMLDAVTAACQTITAIQPARNVCDENAWRLALDEDLKNLCSNEHVAAALKVVMVPTTDVTSRSPGSLTVEEVRSLSKHLTRLKVLGEMAPPKPRALVKAMQALYIASSAEDSMLALTSETADEEALSQLTARTEEFVPALSAMRSISVDHVIFEHLADKSDDEGNNDVFTESEASDVEKELVGKKETAPVVLPKGWRLEWVKRKKREAREFVDPAGNRYHNVREVRARLVAHGGVVGVSANSAVALDAAAEAAQHDREAHAQAVAAERQTFGDSSAPKRMRLIGKSVAHARQAASEVTFHGDMQEDLFKGLTDDFGSVPDEVFSRIRPRDCVTHSELHTDDFEAALAMPSTAQEEWRKPRRISSKVSQATSGVFLMKSSRGEGRVIV